MDIIELKGVKKGFGPLSVLRSLDMKISSGGIYGFLGENASGKTTTIRLIMGLLEPEAGEVKVLGENPSDYSIATKARISYVPEEQVLPEWMRLKDLSEFHGAHFPRWKQEEFERIRNLFEIPSNATIASLSKGSKRKAALALALSTGADLYVLDEPASGLDPNARMDFMDTLMGLFQEEEKTVLFSTHLLSDLEKSADFVLMLYDGKIVLNEALDNLREKMVRIHVSGNLNVETIKNSFNVLDTDEAIANGDFVIIDDGKSLVDRFIEEQKGLARKMPFSLDDLFRRITKKEKSKDEII
ncbi:MAG: hypothetical protein A2017_12620 [Lentisphaerae bacterium GWF2_44_16]|nr:MAG: hypothetical protein A2017_12620 [Lentisphaerae bacterium GWF2_44_16]